MVLLNRLEAEPHLANLVHLMKGASAGVWEGKHGLAEGSLSFFSCELGTRAQVVIYGSKP